MSGRAQGDRTRLADPRPAGRGFTRQAGSASTSGLIVAAAIAAFPVVRVFSTALRPGDNSSTPAWISSRKGATLDAFHRVLFDSGLPNWLFNSLVVTLGTAAVGLILAATSAYAFSRYQFRGRDLGLTFLFATQLIPGHHAAGAHLPAGRQAEPGRAPTRAS